jgi:hypothetical protein
MHPGIALEPPCRNFRIDDRTISDAPVQALAAQYVDLNLRYVQPTGVLRCLMKR